MAYLGISPTRTDNRKLDTPLQRVSDSGYGFNGTATQFYLTIETNPVYPDSELLLNAVLNGSTLNPKVDFFIQSNIITFTTAPASNAVFFGILGDRVSLNKPGTDTVTTATIKDQAVTTAKIADNAITSDKIAPGTVIASDVADGAVTTSKLDGTPGSEAVTTAKIRDLNVTTGKIADTAVTTGKIADGAITSAKIADGAIVTGDIADSSITSAKIVDGTIATVDIANSAITTAKIADSNITSAKIATSAVTPDKLNLTVTSDPASPVDGQFIWNTFTNVPKIYNSDTSSWNQIITDASAGTLVGWNYLSSIPVKFNNYTDVTTGLSPQTTVNDYVYGNAKHVIVSNGGKILTSTNLSSWTTATTGTSNNFNTISWSTPFYVAGASNNVISTSSDAVTWNTTNGPFTSNGADIVASIFANGRYLLGSSFGNIAYSLGSTTFTSTVSNISSAINSFAYGNGVYLAGGSSGEISTSVDGATWTSRYNIGGSKKVFVSYGNSKFLALVSNTSNGNVDVLTSTDAVTWTTAISNPYNITNVGINSLYYSSVSQAFVVTTSSGASYRSSDFVDWALIAAPALSLGVSINSIETKFALVASTETLFVFGQLNNNSVLSPYLTYTTWVVPSTTLSSNKNYILDSNYGAFTCYMPPNPSVGDVVAFADGSNTWSTYNVTLSASPKNFLVNTGSTDNTLILDYTGVSTSIIWTGNYWRVF